MLTYTFALGVDCQSTWKGNHGTHRMPHQPIMVMSVRTLVSIGFSSITRYEGGMMSAYIVFLLFWYSWDIVLVKSAEVVSTLALCINRTGNDKQTTVFILSPTCARRSLVGAADVWLSMPHDVWFTVSSTFWSYPVSLTSNNMQEVSWQTSYTYLGRTNQKEATSAINDLLSLKSNSRGDPYSCFYSLTLCSII